MKKWKSLEELTEWETRIIDKVIKDQRSPLSLKSILLCFGVGDSPLVHELASMVNPSRERRTGNTGIPLELSNNARMNVLSSVVYEKEPNQYFTAASPLRLEGNPDDIEIYFKGNILDKAKLAKPDKWVSKKTKNGRAYSSIFLAEGGGKFIMGTIPVPCCYQVEDKACLFCEYTNVDLDKSVEDFTEVAVAAFKDDPSYRLTMTGGNTRTEDRGLKRYIPFVKNISKEVAKVIGKKPIIQIEISPPDFSSGNGERYIDELAEAGATSFMMNLEQGDDKYRRIICPEKSKIPYSDYIRAFEYITKEKDMGACSILINGLLEPPESTVRYAEMLTELGVKPIIQPFRPFGKLKRNYPSNPIEFEQVNKEVSELIDRNNVNLSKVEGCANCPGCSVLEQDNYNVQMCSS
ncbi:radical SAM protein [Candidatus Woesearchaeota archaeon]|nr:radical SAM protein [Candidatus Woesearchaeota archaeon]